MIDIKKLRELEGKATPGPWEVYDKSGRVDFIYPAVGLVAVDGDDENIILHITPADAALIAAARNAMPDLLDLVEAQGAENAALKERLAAAEQNALILAVVVNGLRLLMQESDGVAGYHLNGDLLEWDEYFYENIENRAFEIAKTYQPEPEDAS